MVRDFPQLEQDVVFPPGETLLETLEHLGMTQLELARRTGTTPKHINHLVKGKAPISPEMAIALESATGVPADLWMNLEKNYQVFLARVRERETLNQQASSLPRFQTSKMAQYGWIEGSDDKAAAVKQVLMLLGVSHLDQWEAAYNSLAVSYRKSETFDCDKRALTLWLRQGERQIAEIQCAPYDADAFRAALLNIRSMTADLPQDFATHTQHLCARAGVAVAFVPELAGCRVSGATRWINPSKALILLSARYKTDDHLWFSFFHEAGHILLHDKREAFLDHEGTDGSPAEQAADEFAREFLIPNGDYQRFVERHGKRIGRDAVLQFSRILGIAPGIIVGRLQHDGHLPYRNLNSLKRKLAWDA
jgi:addiction module HigA family antidote